MEQIRKRSILADEKDQNRIKAMCPVKIWNEEEWWNRIYEQEDNIALAERRKAEDRRYERRKQALKDREENTPELPEKKILERADLLYFQRKHFLYYKKSGSWAKIACTRCGGVSDGRWKGGDSYESQFQRRVEEPREGRYGTCPLCGERGEYKCQGKVKGGLSRTVHLFLGQKYKGTGMVLRYMEVTKNWMLGMNCGEKGPEMFDACEELSGTEIARAYFEDGKNIQIDYHKHSYYSGEDFWDDCNLYGHANINIKAAPIMRETYREMEGTIFQYSALEQYADAEREVNPIKYLERYQEIPQMEMLVKLGLIGAATELVWSRYGIIQNRNAKCPDKFLGIRKERVKLLVEQRGDIGLLKMMKIEKQLGQTWTEEQLKQISETRMRREQIELALEYMSIQKLLNRIAKYAGCEYGTGRSCAEERIRQAAGTYADYMEMRVALGYDLHNTVYQQPRSLTAAHEKMILESNKGKMGKRLQEVAEKFPMIRKNYRNLRNRYFYEDGKFMIRPARSAEEIVMEGRILHHCVGGDGYLEKHNNGKTYILMLRFKEDQETPYITVEIGAEDNRIIQWYGAHDKKPDEKNMRKWLDSYITRLRCGTLAAGQPDDGQMLRIAI